MVTNVIPQPETTKLRQKIVKPFEQKIKSSKSFNTGILLVHSPSMGVHFKTAVNRDTSVFVDTLQPFHFASIGKTITSVMIGILYEQNLLSYNNKISMYIDSSIINGLHVYKDTDYSGQILIKHLLGHTSGIPDHYFDKNPQGVNLHMLMISQPNRFWTPLQTIEWTKQNLKPKFKPGSGFHYSDTNYELLGLIIEKITGLELHQAFNKFIFEPLQMDNTWLLFGPGAKNKNNYPMVCLMYKGLNLSKAKSISMSYASGGVVSTCGDMLKFQKAIVDGKIILGNTFNQMCNFNKMGPGFYYGYGIMNFRFMFMPKKYHIWGNSGSIGAFMYYNSAMDTYIIGSYNKVNYQVQPIFFILNTLIKLNRYKKSMKHY